MTRTLTRLGARPNSGEYIDKMLQDMEEQGIRADRSTKLGCLVSLRLGRCLDGTVDIPAFQRIKETGSTGRVLMGSVTSCAFIHHRTTPVVIS